MLTLCTEEAFILLSGIVPLPIPRSKSTKAPMETKFTYAPYITVIIIIVTGIMVGCEKHIRVLNLSIRYVSCKVHVTNSNY